MLIKKKFIFTKHMVYAFLLFIVLIFLFPVTTLSQFYRAEGHAAADTTTQGDFSRLFYWFKPADFSMPPGYFSYTKNNGGWWTIPFILLGIFSLFTKRKKDVSILLLSWLIGQYIMIHLDVFGLVRAFRALDSEAYILYPLAVIGFFSLFALIKKRPLNTYIKVAGSIALIALILLNNAPTVISTLKGSYQLPNRINPAEFELAQWIRTSDIALDKNFIIHGTLSQQILRYIRTVSQRYMTDEKSMSNQNLSADFLIFDYSILEQAKSYPQYKQQYDSLKAMEEELDQSNIVYDKNNIKVYKNE